MNTTGEAAGTLDLESMMSYSVSVYGPDSSLRYSGKFRFLGGKWEVLDPSGFEIGLLRARFTLFSKRYEYDAGDRGVYSIEAPAFSHEYSILDESETEVASFQRVSGWLQAGAFQLQNRSSQLDSYELIAVIMGVHSIQKRQSSAAAT